LSWERVLWCATRNDTIDIEVTLHAETALAILVSDDGDEDTAVWLPKSQIEYPGIAIKGFVITVTLPEWLAMDKGLI
jgi:hypothetical protein